MRNIRNLAIKLVVSAPLYHSCMESQNITEQKSYQQGVRVISDTKHKKAKFVLDLFVGERRKPFPSVGINRLVPPMHRVPGSRGRWIIRKVAGKQVQVILIRFAV